MNPLFPNAVCCAIVNCPFVLFFLFTTESCLILCNPRNYSTPGFPVLHYFPEFAQTHVHWVSDAIQPSHPLLPPFPSALDLPLHQGLFQWVSSLHQEVLSIRASASASALPMNIQGWFPLGVTGLSPFSPRDSQRVFSFTVIQKHQFFSARPSLWSNSHIHTWWLEKP